MSESVFIQIKKELGEEKAQEIINEMRRNPHKEAIEGALAIYSSLSYQQAEEILQKHGYSVEAAFEELEKENGRAEEERTRFRMIEEKNKLEQETQQYIELFTKHFKSLSKEEITKVFGECGRDPKRTSQALVELIKQKERQNEESQRVKRELQINNMGRIYAGIYAELEEGEVLRVIREHDLDDEKINKALDVENKQRMFEALYVQFCEKLSAQEIQQFLKESEWKKLEAAKLCLVRSKEKGQQQVELQAPPRLELDEKELQEMEHQSITITIPNIQKLRRQEEERQEQQTLQLIQSSLIDHLEPEQEELPVNQESQELSHSIAVTEVDGKLHAKARVIGENSYSWIGFYKKGEADGKYLTYNYVCNLKDKTLIVDKPALNGEYEFRSFLSKYQIACKSEPVIVNYSDKVVLREVDEKTVAVTWRVGSFDPYQSRAYVTIHKVEEERYNYYRRWNWMEVMEGSHSFKRPIHSGVYEARVYIGKELKFKSGTIEVQGI